MEETEKGIVIEKLLSGANNLYSHPEFLIVQMPDDEGNYKEARIIDFFYSKSDDRVYLTIAEK